MPNLFISHQINDVTWIGFGFTVPFGLSTEYGEDWEQSREGTEAKIEVYDFNPSFAWKLSDKVSLGAGISYQYVKADLGFNWTELYAGIRPRRPATVGVFRRLRPAESATQPICVGPFMENN